MNGATISDGGKALFFAAIADGLAVLLVFGLNPGGFETQGVWLLVFLPATLIAYPLSDLIYAHAPLVESILFWPMVIAFNFLWYWLLSSIGIKIRRALS